jgi:Fe-S cluster assembly protein SufB
LEVGAATGPRLPPKGEVERMATTQEEHLKELTKGYRFGWKDPAHYVFEPKRGLSEEVVEEISFMKSEPEWMRKFRL